MGHLLYLMFRCNFDVMESLKSLEELGELNTAKEKFGCQGVGRGLSEGP